jgi:NAD(P) transhydrogenase
MTEVNSTTNSDATALTQDYDLVVLGSGPAGEKGAAQAAYFGKKVALVERADVLGGSSCNTGSLPSKTLRESALALSGLRSRDLFGVDLAVRRGATVNDFLAHERRVTSAEREAIAENVRRHNIDVYHGEARFADQHTIRVSTESEEEVLLRCDFVLIATGSSPLRPSTFPFDDPRVWDSDQIVNLDFMPGRMAIIGGGVIGCEYASTFAALGVDVFLVDERTELLDFLDRDVWAVLQKAMTSLGVRFVTGERVLECRSDADSVRISLQSDRAIEVDAVLVAAGRRANTDHLNLDAAGIMPDSRGRIAVNEYFQTNVKHVYAAGDVVGFPALASTSMEQARLAMVHAFDLKYKKSAARVLPLGVFTIPEVSVAGETENSLIRKGIPYVSGRAYYDANPRGKIIGDRVGLLKLLFRDPDMKLLGVSVLGENAAELVHVGLVALMVEADNSLFIETCFNYPTLGQLYKYATYDAMGRKAGLSLSNEAAEITAVPGGRITSTSP